MAARMVDIAKLTKDKPVNGNNAHNAVPANGRPVQPGEAAKAANGIDRAAYRPEEMDIDGMGLDDPPKDLGEPRKPLDERRRILRTNVTKWYIHPTMYQRDGIIIQFINHLGNDMGSVIGGVRIGLTEIALFPEYLVQYEGQVKAHAAAQLQRHLERSQSAVGLGENLTVDDFSMTFMIASVTEEAALVNPNTRNEGPLWMCHFPTFTRKIQLNFSEEEPDSAYMVNGYINLVHANQRRRLVAIKLQKEATQKAEAAAAAVLKQKEKDEKAANAHLNPPPKKAARPNSPTHHVNQGKKTFTPSAKQLHEQMQHLKKKLIEVEAKATPIEEIFKEKEPVPVEEAFPAPKAKCPTPFWIKDDLPDLD